ncbi:MULTISPECIES: imidazole glycerol phosphate synthase subunit HisH [Synergistaceae]|jgi:glutamine amidotransferase|uniref:imidazole glycerol phosphate synthase subunit HisH n=1 Tax=Synergistaceae TaxID=649777 RepID=UPI003AEBDB34|nr:imidazole glycerol phosphate synthase subunit HisH [Synergistaceae bacterium DZ-S4]
MIAIIDYGAGNLQSVRNALDFIGCPGTITSDPAEILSADGIILPGVGAFGSAMAEMERKGLTETVKSAAKSGKPFIGICAGMQLLFEESEESPDVPGLGVLKGRVLLFPADKGLKIPHMGWNSIRTKKESRLLGKLSGSPYMYFVHSYYVKAEDQEIVSALSDYGTTFDAAVEQENLFGCQFHPEKSGTEGISILRRFAELAGGN